MFWSTNMNGLGTAFDVNLNYNVENRFKNFR